MTYFFRSFGRGILVTLLDPKRVHSLVKNARKFGGYEVANAEKQAVLARFQFLGVFAHLVVALVFKSSWGIFRLFGLTLDKRCKYLLFQVVAATILPVDIVGWNAEKGLFSTSKG